MGTESSMYQWRKLTPEQRAEVLAERKRDHRPWHSPPHFVSDAGLYMITAACYEHRAVIGVSPRRMVEFESELLETVREQTQQVFAWTVLPNHYHLLVHAPDVLELLRVVGRLHGRTSFRWNGEDRCRGRQVWHRAAETAIKSDRHFWVTLNYVLRNAVRHGYVDRWYDWPYSNAASYLAEIGGEAA